MIFIGIQNLELAKFLKKSLHSLGAQVRVFSSKEKGFLKTLYDVEVSALVSDEFFFGMSKELSTDILNSLAQRIPVIVLSRKQNKESKSRFALSNQLTVIFEENEDEVLTALGVLGSLDNKDIKSYCSTVPHFNIKIPINRLKENASLSVILIDASGFSKVGILYGLDVYATVKEVLQEILFDLWGEAGNFRDTDTLCRKSNASNIYYLFLSRSRELGILPKPGALEQVADRLTANIQNALWEELSSRDRRIPSCVSSLPPPSVGYVSILDNPCIEPTEIIEGGLDAARKIAEAQQRRLKERHLELMQTLIQSEHLLTPEYQAVFRLGDIKKQAVEEALKSKSIEPLKKSIYGFESLIRVNKNLTSELMANSKLNITGLEAGYLRPDVLFGMAKITKVSLELDQSCLKHAADHSLDLPGVLMVNILPRNLYYIDKLCFVFKKHSQVMFEVSESEAINNFELMKKSCALLESIGMSIAADDFGKGFSSLERIIKIRPSIIKFDRSMIENIHSDPIKQAYVRGMVEAAKIIHTTVLAEGVEKWEEAEFLQKIGIELVQGFLFHRPTTAQVITHQLNSITRQKAS